MELRLPLNKSQTGLSTTLSNKAPLDNQGGKSYKKNTLKSDIYWYLLAISNVCYYFLHQILCIITCNIFALILDLPFPVQNFKFLPFLEQTLQGRKWRLTLYYGNIAAIKSSFYSFSWKSCCQSIIFFLPNPSSSF